MVKQAFFLTITFIIAVFTSFFVLTAKKSTGTLLVDCFLIEDSCSFKPTSDSTVFVKTEKTDLRTMVDHKLVHQGKTIFDVSYDIDKNSYREYDHHLGDTKKSLVFLGCSDIFGIGVNKENTISHLVSKKLSYNQIINNSRPASGPNYALYILNKTLEDIENDEGTIFYILSEGHI